MKNRMMPLFLLAGVCGLMTVFLVHRVLQREGEPRVEVQPMPMVEIVVAAESLPTGYQIEPRDLKTMEWPAAQVPAEAFTDMAALNGRFTGCGVVEGVPILQSMLLDSDSLLQELPEGHRALTLRVDSPSWVVAWLTPGQRIDVLVTANDQDGQNVSKMLLQQIKVLQVPEVDQGRGERALNRFETPEIIVSVTPAQAERLALAMATGQIHIMSRASSDDRVVRTSGISTEGLMPIGRFTNRPVITVDADGEEMGEIEEVHEVRVVEVIRGVDRSETEFDTQFELPILYEEAEEDTSAGGS